MNIVIEALGWIGSALLVASILQTRMRRLRILSLIACGLLTWYNAIIGVWPMIAVNATIGLINAYFLVQGPRQDRRAARQQRLEHRRAVPSEERNSLPGGQ